MLLAKKDVEFVAETIPTGETFSMLQELAKELSSSLDYLARFPSAMTPRRQCCSTRHLCLRTRASWSPSTAISICWTWPWRRPVQETVLDGLHQGRKDLTSSTASSWDWASATICDRLVTIASTPILCARCGSTTMYFYYSYSGQFTKIY